MALSFVTRSLLVILMVPLHAVTTLIPIALATIMTAFTALTSRIVAILWAARTAQTQTSDGKR